MCFTCSRRTCPASVCPSRSNPDKTGRRHEKGLRRGRFLDGPYRDRTCDLEIKSQLLRLWVSAADEHSCLIQPPPASPGCGSSWVLCCPAVAPHRRASAPDTRLAAA